MTDDQQNNGQYTGGFSFGNQGGQGAQQPAQPTPPPAPAPAGPAPVQPVAPAPAPMPPAAPLAGMAGGGTPPKDQGSGPPKDDPNYVFGSTMATFTTTITLPPHQLQLDANKFINLLAGSISLTKDEKKKIVDSVPKLRQQQVDELIRIFEEERAKFVELSPKHGAQLKKLELEHLADWKDIELMYKSESKGKEDDAAAEDLRKQLGL